MKVVLDTNVFISAFLWQKDVKGIFSLARDRKVEICATEEILDEFRKVLTYSKFASRLLLINKTPQQVINEATEVVKLYPPRKLGFTIIYNDPTDDKFLTCALEANADFIVSGDTHLLKLKSFHNIPIVTPRQFLNHF